MALLKDKYHNWRTLTRVVNSIKPANVFLSQLLFSNENENADDTLEIHVRSGTRKMPPFVKKGSAAQIIKGLGHDVRQVTPPTIRLKMPFEPHKYLAEPAPGVVSVMQQGDQSALARSAMQRVANDVEEFERYVQNAIEWLCGKTMGNASGAATVTYDSAVGGQQEETDAFTITWPRDAANSLVPAAGEEWDDTTPGDPVVLVRSAKEQLVEATGQSATHLIMGTTVSSVFLAHAQVRADLDTRRLNQAGPLILGGGQIIEGAVFEGSMYGLDIWTYGRKVSILGPDLAEVVSDDIIDPKSAYLVSVPNARSNFTVEYGGIHDWAALEAGTLAQRRFMKAWVEQDPSAAWRLIESRPIPVPYEVDAVVQIRPLT